MSRRPLALALLAAAVLAACAGCGASQPVAHAKGGRIAVALDDFLFDPQTISARSGPLTFELHNRGRLAHSFRLRRAGKPVAQVPSLQPGESRTVTLRLKPGNYRIFCALANHEQLGMYGTLTVR